MIDTFKTTDKKLLRVPELAEILSQNIERNRTPGDTPMESTRKLAARYGVSPVTANRAINELVNRKVLYRIQGKGTFIAGNRPWQNARIGLYLYPGFNLHSKDYCLWFGYFNQYLTNLLKQNGFDISLISDIERNNPDILKRTISSTDALLLNKDVVTRENLPLLTSFPGPVILLEQPCLSDEPFHQVVPNLYFGFRRAADYLAELQVRQVVIVGVGNTETHQYRRRKFREILNRFHPEIELLDDLTHDYILNDYGQECGELIAEKYLQLPSHPAIFSVSDYLSFGLLKVLQAHGLQPKKDFLLVSYDNMESYGVCPFKEPVLTTIEHPYKPLIEEVVKLLTVQLQHPEDRTLKIVRVPSTKLILRTTA